MKIYNIEHMPCNYFYRHTASDRAWIAGHMKFIPEDKQEAICTRYVQLVSTFSKDPIEIQKKRNDANSYLKSRAAEYRAKNAS